MNNKKVIEFGLSYEELWRSWRVLSGILFTVGSVDRSIGWYSGLSSDYRPSVDRPSTECWPITDRYVGQVSTNYRRSVGEKSAKCLWTKSYIGRDTSGTTIDRVSTDYRPLYWPTIDRVSTDYRPSVDRLLTDCRPLYRPLYRPIDQSTLPTVNMIRVTPSSISIILHKILTLIH